MYNFNGKNNQNTLYMDSIFVSKILKSVFENSPISHFDYQKCFTDSKAFYLSNNPSYAIDYYQNNLYPRLDELKKLVDTGIKFTFLSGQLPLPTGLSSSDI